MIKATTPTSQGFAQAFDTSGLVQLAYEDRERKRSRFEKTVKSYDPSSVWYRDMPEFQTKVNEYYSYIGENYDALANKSKNIDKWQEMKTMENELLNFTAQSKAMEQTWKQASNLMLDKPESYDTMENQQLLDDIVTGNAYGGLSEGYKTGDAMNNTFMKQFGRNIFIDTASMTDQLREIGKEDMAGINVGHPEDKMRTYQFPITYKPEELKTVISDWWQNGFSKGSYRTSASDLQRKYGTIEEFADVVTAGLPTMTSPKVQTVADGDTEDTDKFFVEPETGATGFQATGSINRPSKGAGAIKEGIKKRREGAAYVAPTDIESQDVYLDAYNQGSVTVGGTKAIFNLKAGTISGLDLVGNVYSDVKLTSTNKVRLDGVTTGYAVNDADIIFKDLTTKDAQGNEQKTDTYVAKKGTMLSAGMVEKIKRGEAIVMVGGQQVAMKPSESNTYTTFGNYASLRGASSISGIDLGDRTSFRGSLDEKQYWSILMPWDEFQEKSDINSARAQKVQDMIDEATVQENTFNSPARNDVQGDPDSETLIDVGAMRGEAGGFKPQ